MGRTPSKKKSGSTASLRSGPRDPRQHVYSSGSGSLSASRGNRRGMHGTRNTSRSTSLPPILERNPVLERNAMRAGAAIDLRNFPNNEGVARAGASALSMRESSDDDCVIVHNHLRDLIAYEGDENPDVEVQKALLSSKMVEQLKRKANAQVLGFQPDHFKMHIENLNGLPPRHERRDQLVAMALQADQGGVLMGRLLAALPPKITRKTTKSHLAGILVEVFFIVEDMIVSRGVVFSSTHSGLGKALNAFCSDLVRVRNYCKHDLENELVSQKALKSENITGEFTLSP